MKTNKNILKPYYLRLIISVLLFIVAIIAYAVFGWTGKENSLLPLITGLFVFFTFFATLYFGVSYLDEKK